MSILYPCQSHAGITRSLNFCRGDRKESVRWKTADFHRISSLLVDVYAILPGSPNLSLSLDCFARTFNLSLSHLLVLGTEMIAFDTTSRKHERLNQRESEILISQYFKENPNIIHLIFL